MNSRFITLLFILGALYLMSFGSHVWAAGDAQTIPTVTAGTRGVPVQLPEGLVTNPAQANTPSSAPTISFVSIVVIVAGGIVLVAGAVGLLSWLGWIKIPK